MITVPPQMRTAGPAEYTYRAIGMQEMFKLKQQLALGKLNMGTRRVKLENGVEITCTVCFGKADIYVKIPPVVSGRNVVVEAVTTGFFLHPRSGTITQFPYYEYVKDDYGSHEETRHAFGISGGWTNGTTPLSQNSIFPLVDEDNASFRVTEDKDSNIDGGFAGSSGSYGNLYWWNGDAYNPILLSWHGTPTRHFRVPYNINIPGISNLETYMPGLIEDTPKYTCFTQKLYQNGSVLAESPRFSWPYNASGPAGHQCLILGACSNKGAIYIATLSDHYLAPAYYASFSDGGYAEGESDSVKTDYLFNHPNASVVLERNLTKPGYFLTLWKQGTQINGWDFVSESAYGDYGVPFFANEDGTSFVDSLGTVVDIYGAITYPVVNKGLYSETAIDAGDNNYRFDALYNSFTASEYVINVLSKGIVSCLVDSYSSNNFPDAGVVVQHDPVDVVIPADGNIFGHIYVPSFNAAGDGFVIGGEFYVDMYWTCDCEGLKITWSIPGTSVENVTDSGSRVRVLSSSGICGGTVTITVSSGVFSQSTKVVFPHGKWVIENSGSFGCEWNPYVESIWWHYDCPGGWAPSYIASCSDGSCFVYTTPWYSSGWGCAYTTCLKLKSQSETMAAFSVNTTDGSCLPTVYSWWGNVFATNWKTCSWVCASDPRSAVDPNHLG